MAGSANRRIYLVSILGVLLLIVYITGLFPEGTVDSAKYAAISRHIYETGDLINLKIHNEPYMHKPPLLFWLGALSFSIFGLSITSFKIPTLLFFFLGIYSVYRLGTLIFDRKTGRIAAILFSANVAVLLYLMDVHTDLLLTSFIIFGIWQIMEYLENKKIINYIAGFAGIGMAMITKGFLGLVIPVFAIGGYLFVKKDFRTLFSLKWLAGLLILTALLYPALKGAYNQFGAESLKFYFWSNNLDRIRGDYSNGRHDYFFVIHTLAYILLPWSFYMFGAFIRDFKNWKRSGFKTDNPRETVLYSGLIIYSLIISVSSQQAPHYLLPVVPFVSIIAARYISNISFAEKDSQEYRVMLILGLITTCLLWSGIIMMITYFFPTYKLLVLLFLLISLLITIISILKLRDKIRKLLVPGFVTITALAFVSNTVYMPSALKYHGVIQASYLYNRLATDSSKLYTYDYPQFETYFYPKNVSLKIYPEQLNKLPDQRPCWVITTEKGKNEIFRLCRQDIEINYSLPYHKLTNLSLKFLNPTTRDSTLSKIFLIKLKG